MPLVLIALAATIRAESPWVDLWKAIGPGGGKDKNVTSMWGPSLVVAKNKTILAFGECDRSPTSHNPWMAYRRSHDGGATWEAAKELYGCGSPAGLVSRSTDTIFVFFGECGAPAPKGAPYAMAAMSCKGGSVHWRYNSTSKQLHNANIAAPGSPIGVHLCEGGVKPSAGDSLAVGMKPDQPEPCPPDNFKWTVDNVTGYVRHDNTGLCLTILPHKSATLEPCGASTSEGQKYVFNGDMLVLAPGMFRSGECLGYLNTKASARSAQAQFNKCVAAQDLSCNMTRFRDVVDGYPACKGCLSANAAALTNATGDARCTAAQMEPLNVTNTWGPSYAGNDVAHGIEMEADGPHKGRLAIARRYDATKAVADAFSRSYVLYSDDHGTTWTAGELLPVGWTECQVAELKNGSLVLTSRLTGHGFNSFYCNGTDMNCFQRGFARSDDGGATWGAAWYLEERQPEIIRNNCENAMVSDPATGTLYWGHPGAVNMTRSNYTVHKSNDGGLSWELLDVTYAHGAGYSDVHVLHTAAGEPYLGVLFQRTLYEPGAEGGGYNLALASVSLH